MPFITCFAEEYRFTRCGCSGSFLCVILDLIFQDRAPWNSGLLFRMPIMPIMADSTVVRSYVVVVFFVDLCCYLSSTIL